MSRKLHRIVEVSKNLGFLSIPLICVPLLLPLVMAKVPTQTPKLTPPLIVKQPVPLKEPPAEAEWHRQLIDQSLLFASSTKETHPRSAATSNPPLEMKIAIANTSNLVVATSKPGLIVDDSGHTLKTLSAGQGFSAITSGQKIEFKGNSGAWQVPTSIWIKAPGGFVYINQHWYRGQVHLVHQGFSLLAVNHVNLDDYLYSVVGSEMPSYWPIEALKAQAIAARSYALAHYVQPASPLYQMGADQASQVYKGLDGEASSTHQAVNQTLGQFLSYRGGVVESLYADTDEIVIKAHGGLGMSQTGAMQLAKQGYDYLHILGAYYPGTSLARLPTSTSTRQGYRGE